MGRHVLPQQLPYTWSGFVWIHVVIINCHVANSCVETLPVFIVLFKSEKDKTQRQIGQLQPRSRPVTISGPSILVPTLHPHNISTLEQPGLDGYTCYNLNTLCT